MKTKKIETGLYPHMSDEEYFKSGELHNSDFRLLAESALHFANKELFKLEGAKFITGLALHCQLLEPQEYNKRYAVESFDGCELNKNSKAYKEAKADWIKTTEGKDILSVDEHAKISKMATNARAIAGQLLTGGEAEVAMFAEIDGVLMAGKADYINHELGYIFDVKTTQSIAKFGQSAVEYNYLSQSALYPDIMKKINGKDYKFAFILIESTAPHMVSIQTAGGDMIEIGRSIYAEMITRYKDWRDEGIVDIEKRVKLPKWYLESQGYGLEV